MSERTWRDLVRLCTLTAEFLKLHEQQRETRDGPQTPAFYAIDDGAPLDELEEPLAPANGTHAQRKWSG